ncbi:MAG: class I SAM-dependent methyltransferase [Oscillospiraceae bacterium]|nr:class I SAM-dependent methyltransferase [Oscillospiraceae bacterium]
MIRDIDENLARSLTAETVELLPFLPYLLQDLWELGSSPRDMITLIKRHIPLSENSKILDLACGKGAVSVRIAESLGVHVHGFDLFPDFVKYAEQKAAEFGVDKLCRFTCGDANETVETERNYDCVIFGAAGNILGEPRETLEKLAKTIKFNGFIIIDEAYLPDDMTNDDVKYQNYEYLTRGEWLQLFDECGLTLVEELQNTDDYDFDSDNKLISTRTDELIAKHPDKRAIFENYVASQLNECEDLESNITAITWILQKKD